MKKVLSAAFILSLSVFAFAGCSQEITADSWKPYTSAAGGYSVQMPGSPETSTQNVPTDVGNLPMHIASVERNGGRLAFMVFYNDYPLDEIDSEQSSLMLNEAKTGVIEGYANTSVTNEEDLMLDGNPGKQFDFTTTESGQKISASWKIYVRGKRLYQVALISVGSKFVEGHRDTFFDSFQFQDLP